MDKLLIVRLILAVNYCTPIVIIMQFDKYNYIAYYTVNGQHKCNNLLC